MVRDCSLFLRGGGGSYQQNTSQKHVTTFVETKKVMIPFGIYKKVMTPSAYATIMISIIKIWLKNQNFFWPPVGSRGNTPGGGPGGGAPGSSWILAL